MKGMKRTPVPLPGSLAKSKERKAAPKFALSQEFVDSDNDSPVEKSGPSKQAERTSTPTVIHGASKAAKMTSKSTEKKHSARMAAPKSASPSKKLESRQSPPEQRSEVSSTSDSSSDIFSEAPVVSPSSQASKMPAKSHAVAFQAASNFIPPRGFHAVSVNEETISTRPTMFDSLKGKQVWHITAPADVSLKSLSSLAMDKALEGDAVLTYKGAEYGFSNVQKSGNGAKEVLIPRHDGYTAVTAPFSQIFHLQTIVRLPLSSFKQESQHAGSETSASITRSTIRAPRLQAKGLKMRFLPTGFSSDAVETIGGSDSEVEAMEEATGLRMPNASELHSKKIKKDRTPEEVNRVKARRAKKEKKRARRD